MSDRPTLLEELDRAGKAYHACNAENERLRVENAALREAASKASGETLLPLLREARIVLELRAEGTPLDYHTKNIVKRIDTVLEGK